MKQLKTDYNGGFPFTLNRLRWVYEGITEAWKGLFYGLNGGSGYDDLILSGTTITLVDDTPFTYTCDEGFIVIDGEICYVPAVVAPTVVAGAAVYWDIDLTTFDAAGNVAFQDAVSHNTYQKRTAKLFGAASKPSGRLAWDSDINTNGLGDRIASIIVNKKLEFNGFISFPNQGGKTLTNTDCLDLANTNTAQVNYDGTIPNLRSVGTLATNDEGNFMFLQFIATGSPSDKLIIKHNDTSGGGIKSPLWTRNRRDAIISDGDVVGMYFQSGLWLLITEHPSATTLDDWHEVGAGGQPIFKNGFGNASGYGTAAFKLLDNEVLLKGVIYVNPTDTGGEKIAFTLPANYQPNAKRLIGSVARYDTSPNYVTIPVGVEVATNGDVHIYIEPSLSESSLKIGLDGVRILLS